MKKSTHLFFALALMLITAVSCKRDKDPVPIPAVDVYVAGVYLDNGVSKALYWKNGTPTPVADLSMESYAYGIAVDQGHVYMIGQFNSQPCLWKDGVRFALKAAAAPVQNGTPNAILINNGIIYVVGIVASQFNQATLWKVNTNGEVLNQYPLVNNQSQAYDLCLNGTTVYICGSENNKACYWTWDGTNAPSAAIDFNANSGLGLSTVVFGGKTYVLGSTNINLLSTYGYWELPSQAENFHSVGFGADVANLNNMAVNSQGKLYFTGNKADNAITYGTLWKENGTQAVRLSEAMSSYGNAIAINGTDTYVAGYDDGLSWLWKNDTKTFLTLPAGITNSYAYDVVLVKK